MDLNIGDVVICTKDFVCVEFPKFKCKKGEYVKVRRLEHKNKKLPEKITAYSLTHLHSGLNPNTWIIVEWYL